MTTRELTLQLSRIEKELKEVRHALYTNNQEMLETNREQTLAALRNIQGMMKGKWPDDPVAWQRKIRGEWDD